MNLLSFRLAGRGAKNRERDDHVEKNYCVVPTCPESGLPKEKHQLEKNDAYGTVNDLITNRFPF
jgi:hypothetical protein